MDREVIAAMCDLRATRSARLTTPATARNEQFGRDVYWDTVALLSVETQLNLNPKAASSFRHLRRNPEWGDDRRCTGASGPNQSCGEDGGA
jgi:hypothetical protein